MSETILNQEANSGYVGSDGKFGDMSSASEPVRSFVENKGFGNVDDMVKSYTNLEGMKGDWNNPQAMKLPDTLSDEQMCTIHSRMGVPDTIEGYDWKAPEGTEIDSDMLDGFKTFAADKKMSSEQFSGAIEFYNEQMGNMAESTKVSNEEAMVQAKESATKELQDTWKDDFEKNAQLADDISKRLGLGEHLEKLGLLNDPVMISALYKIGQGTQEGKLPNNLNTPAKTNLERREDLQKNPAFLNKMHKDHTSIMKQWHETHRTT